MVKRQIIEINRDKCNGCGLCTKICAEEAIRLDEEKKAVLVNEIYCDGLGACLAVCPTGALKVIDKESQDYNPEATYQHVKTNSGPEKAQKVHGVAMPVNKEEILPSMTAPVSVLSNWPVQLQLANPSAPYFNGCDLLISADCTAFAYGNFHQDFLKGRVCVIACPKLDNSTAYIPKLAEIIRDNIIYSLTVVIMALPCCSGLYAMVSEAVTHSGKDLAIKKIVVNTSGTFQKT
jgi:ferredoxin